MQRGKHDINQAFRLDNDSGFLLLHDSEGLESGSQVELDTVKDFLDTRSEHPDIGERLHMVW